MKTKIITWVIFILFVLENISAQIVFQRIYKGTGEYEGFFAGQVTDGGYFIAGRNSLVKTDANGFLLWSKQFSTGFLKCAHQTSDGGYIMAGYTYSTVNFYDGFVLKTDSLGNVLWANTVGGPLYEELYSVEETMDGGYILAGEAKDSLSIEHLYLVKLDGTGNQLWSKLFRGQTDSRVKQTSDGGFIIAGTTFGGCQSYNGSLVKTDSIGNLLWTKDYCDTYIEEFSFTDIQQTTEGGFIISGSVRIPQSIFGADFFLMKTDSLGNITWQNAYAGNQLGGSAFYGVQQTNDGYVATGLSTSFSVFQCAAVLIKTDTTGNLLWSKAYGESSGGVHFLKSMQLTTDGGYILGGHVIPVGAMGTDIFFYLIKIDSTGTSGCRETDLYPNMWNTTMLDMLTVSTSGAGENSAPIPVTVTSGAAEYDYCNFIFSDVRENLQGTFTISPNPFRENFTISFQKSLNNASIKIFNMLGEGVYSEPFYGRQQTINCILNPGIYFVCVSDGNARWTQKLMKQ